MANIEIDGRKYKVTESMGFVHSVGMYVKCVDVDGQEKKAVKRGKRWEFWTPQDRIEPLKHWKPPVS